MRELETSRGFAKQLRKQMTSAETILWVKLHEMRQIGFRFRRQHPIGPYIADFACIRGRLVIELDGDRHGAEERRAYDARRDAFMRARGWKVLRIGNVEVYKNLYDVLDAIDQVLRNRSPSPFTGKVSRREAS